MEDTATIASVVESAIARNDADSSTSVPAPMPTSRRFAGVDAKAQPAVAASVLPFTGGNMLPFLIVSMGLMGVGGASLRRRRTEENEAA